MRSATNFLRQTSVILLIVVFFMGCSKDSDNAIEPCTTFLSCQDQSVWEGQIDLFLYLKFSDNLNSPVAMYLPDGDCYHYSSVNATDFNITILENSKNRLKISMTDATNEWTEVTTFTLANGVLTVQDDYYEDGMEDHATGTFTRSSKNLDSVTFCD
jgi:hypothetical protein